MKNRNTVCAAILVAIAFALAPVAEAGPRPDGGPTHDLFSTARSNANSDAGAKLGKPDDILPLVSMSFAPVGLTLDQTARLNLVNMNVANGITVSWRFMDANGAILAQSSTTLGVGKIISVDFRRGRSAARRLSRTASGRGASPTGHPHLWSIERQPAPEFGGVR